VCAYTGTQTHNTYTSTPCKEWGDTFLVENLTNTSRCKQTPTIDQLETPHLHPSSTHAMVFNTPVKSMKNTYSAYICEEKMTTTK